MVVSFWCCGRRLRMGLDAPMAGSKLGDGGGVRLLLMMPSWWWVGEDQNAQSADRVDLAGGAKGMRSRDVRIVAAVSCGQRKVLPLRLKKLDLRAGLPELSRKNCHAAVEPQIQDNT